MNTILPYMRLHGPQQFITEEYVSTPPALVVIDERANVWTLGTDQGPGPAGEYAFSVLRNGVAVGEYASRIERRSGRIRIFSAVGWKRWNGNSFV